MGNDIQTNQTFEKKMMDRVRDSMGDLMSDEDLANIVERGIQKAFFTEKQGQYHSSNNIPCLAEKMVADLYREAVKAEVANWVKSNPKNMRDLMDKALKDGLSGIVFEAFNNMFKGGLQNMRMEIENSFTNGQGY